VTVCPYIAIYILHVYPRLTLFFTIKDGLDSHVRTGERVRVKVLGVDLETAKISLGMKPSLFTTDDDDDDAGNALAVDTKKEDVLVADETDDEEDEEEADDEDEDDEDEDDDEAKDDDDEAIDADDSDSEDGDALVDDDDEDIEVGGDDEDDDDDDEAGSDDDSEAGSDSEDAAVAMETGDDGLDWDAGDKNLKNALDDDDANDDKTVLTKREKAKKKANKELALHAKELELRHRADAAPENAKEFEKALMGNPRSR
jgi:rRNA biogenesis protein RRP5